MKNSVTMQYIQSSQDNHSPAIYTAKKPEEALEQVKEIYSDWLEEAIDVWVVEEEKMPLYPDPDGIAVRKTEFYQNLKEEK
ncbi:hypothetical protein [Neobacillus sp. 114]|uniref:hypothetical protein n=1 Tax=Neobacillus sp. 114 TaxID=3048535 RepID=UPI0024C36C41|nr:hypothetical protein [Neobacillus sp. 114]